MLKDKNMPVLRFPGFTDPWEQRKFSEVFDGLQNNTFSRAELSYENGTVKNVHYGDVLIKFGDYIDVSETELPYISDDTKVDKFRGSFLQDGDIIIADTAEDDTVGKCTEIQGSEGIKLLSGLHTIACRPKEKYGSKFMGYYINSPAYHNQLKPLMQGIKVTSISKSALQDTDMLIPKSIDEQTMIGSYLSNLDNLITLHQRKYEALKEYKSGMLQKMFPREGHSVPEVRFPSFTDPWEQRKLSDIGEIVTGTTPPTKDKDNYGGGKLFVSPADIQGNRYVRNTITTLTDKGYALGRKLRSGASLFVSIGSTIGKVAQIKDSATTNQQINAVIPYDEMDDNFVFTMLENESDKIKKLSAQQAVPIINKTTFGDIEIKYPDKEEQVKIGEYFSNLDNLITLHQRKCEEIKEIKKGLLQQMFV